MAAGAVATGTREDLIEELRAQLAKISDGKLTVAQIDVSAHVFDYGYVDSLSAVLFLAHVEEAYGVRIDDLDLVERYNTLEAIADHLRQGA